MSFLNVVILSVVQGLAELLPISSSAHVVVVEKLMGLDPSSPEMTLLLAMLHTGTMVAVIVYFWKRWRATFFRDRRAARTGAGVLMVATVLTGIIGEALIVGIERGWMRSTPHADVEQLFGHLELISAALAAVGFLILLASKRDSSPLPITTRERQFTLKQAAVVGAVQGLCLPFRGFSRSGATISTGLLMHADKVTAEDFSFALAVILTPPVVAREAVRLLRTHGAQETPILSAVTLSVFGGACAFLAGLVALSWLSRWLEHGRWHWFGVYCLVAAGAVALLYLRGL